MSFASRARCILETLAERSGSPAQKRADAALERLNEASDRIIAEAPQDHLRDALDSLAKHL